MTQTMLTIIGGPSKFDLMVSLFEGNRFPRHTVIFELSNGSKQKVAITSIQQEDGSGESWNYEGHIEDLGFFGTHVKGYYSSKTRRGTTNLPGKVFVPGPTTRNHR